MCELWGEKKKKKKQLSRARRKALNQESGDVVIDLAPLLKICSEMLGRPFHLSGLIHKKISCLDQL